MKIGVISTRLAGSDGVSLETNKMTHVLHQMGHDTVYCAGELDGDGALIPEMHFRDAVAQTLNQRAFGTTEPDATLLADITAQATILKLALAPFFAQIDYLIVQNLFAIPMQLPLAQAITELLQETGLPALAHNHDFYWERQRFARNKIGSFLEQYFPPDLPNLRHLVINSQAQQDLLARRGITSFVLPNVMDFDAPPSTLDAFNQDFRQALGLTAVDKLLLQPTRVVPRKGIELSIELIARLNDPHVKLVITHHAGDEGLDYLHHLQALAQQKNVSLLYVPHLIGETRQKSRDGKIYTLFDAYLNADLVLYPSLYEGFGNALLEAIYCHCPVFINQYSVYKQDIAPHGFRFIEIEGAVTDEAVEQVREILSGKDVTAVINHNFAIAQQVFGYKQLQTILKAQGL